MSWWVMLLMGVGVMRMLYVAAGQRTTYVIITVLNSLLGRNRYR